MNIQKKVALKHEQNTQLVEVDSMTSNIHNQRNQKYTSRCMCYIIERKSICTTEFLNLKSVKVLINYSISSCNSNHSFRLMCSY